jgi:hypothetical protein
LERGHVGVICAENPDIWSDGDLILKRISETLALKQTSHALLD